MSVFLSYKREDVEVVEKVYEILKARGLDVFIDREIKSGEDFREKLIGQLHNSNCVITFWSENSTKSRWVIDEAEYALGKGILVPVLLDDASPPFGFGDINAANLISWDGDETHPELLKIYDAIEWISNNTVDSVKEIEKGINKILDPLPRKDYREFKTTQNDLNESVVGILQEVLELNQKATENLVKSTSATQKVFRLILFLFVFFVGVYLFFIVNVLEQAFTNMSANMDSMQASVGNISDKMNTMAEDSHIIQGGITDLTGLVRIQTEFPGIANSHMYPENTYRPSTSPHGAPAPYGAPAPGWPPGNYPRK